jgi:uncharacterized tellurite resistance protein B-like protein
MLQALKEFISGLATEPGADEDRVAHDCRLAAAALLFHVADLDGVMHSEETAKLRALIAERFGLDSSQTSRLIAEARAVDREAVDLFHFTNVLNRTLDHDGRLKVIEMMWEMAYADGKPDELQETTVWRVAELMGVSTRERVALRQKAAHNGETPTTGDFVSPWTRTNTQ